MGYMVHHAFIVTCWSNEKIKPVHEAAQRIFGDLVSEIVESTINGYVSFFVAPDGSKEGWKDSEEGDQRRDEFALWVKQNYEKYWPKVALIQYADDAGNDFMRMIKNEEEPTNG